MAARTQSPTSPTRPTGSLDASVEAARRHRAQLRESVDALEAALAAPIPGRATRWVERVHAAMAELSADFREHIAITEGPQGLYAGVLATEPRLSPGVRTLVDEHVALRLEVEGVLAAMEGSGSVPTAAELRERGTVLLGHLVRHRQRGADLVYEAYEVDIGGSG